MFLKSYLNIKSVLLLLVTAGFYSCGSYQYASDNDGIYSSNDDVVYAEEVEQTPAQNNSYYQNYFKEKRMEYEAMNAENEIFTDVDSYSSEADKQQDSIDNSYEGYGSWGADSNEVVVNVYNYNNWYNPYWGLNWGYYGWNWNVGWGWGGYYGGWYYPYYGGYGWYYPNYYYGYPYYGGYPYYYGGYY
ncbi:MAG TPA: hypothetical protein P5264_08320, partial [Mangrovimonas sp.]|nr:hypothetical protein [Mangrovimonas sp.]